MTYLKLYNPNNRALTTLTKFANFYKINLSGSFTLDNFFEINKSNIFNQLSNEQLQALAESKSKEISELTEDDIDKDIELPCPCYLFIEDRYVSYSLIAKNTNFQISEVDTIAFQDAQIQEILNEDTTSVSYIKRMKPSCRVIGWFKTMYFDKSNNNTTNSGLDNIYNLKQTFLDLSKYILSLSTNVSSGGGSFQFSLPHIPLYKGSLDALNMGNITLSSLGNSSAIKQNVQADQSMAIKSEIFSFDYFEWLIQSNDLIFLSFDEISDLEDDNLAGHNFDMIGLVDSVAISKNANGQITVDVSGRDLTKILSEDSSVYFYQGVSSGEDKVFKGFDNTETVIKGGDLDSVMLYKGATQQVNGTMRQLNGNINIFACEPNDFSIDFVLKTVVSHLANMSVVPDDLFTSWGDKRTRFSALQTKRTE